MPPGQVAIVGAGLVGITAARTLAQAGWQATVLQKSGGAGGRMATRCTAFGGFDRGARFGDCCLGYRVESAFLSGLELALRVLGG